MFSGAFLLWLSITPAVYCSSPLPRPGGFGPGHRDLRFVLQPQQNHNLLYSHNPFPVRRLQERMMLIQILEVSQSGLVLYLFA